MKLLPLLLLCFSLFGCDKKSSPPEQAPESSSQPSGPLTEERLGLKIFPGAKVVTSGETVEVVSMNLRTGEPAKTVVKFYEQELGLAESGKGAGTIVGTKNNVKYAVSVVAEGEVTNISIMGKK